MHYDRHCSEILIQTELLATEIKGADLRAPVPSCPGWTLGRLLRHIGGGHRWIEETVRTRATEFIPDDRIRQTEGDDSGEAPSDWLVDGAARLAETLRQAGPDVRVAMQHGLEAPTAFFARRFTHETLVHRADALLAAGREFTAGPDIVLDAVDEWMELDALPFHLEYKPRKRELLGHGRSLTFEATDFEAVWFVDLGGDVITWSRGRRAASVVVRASLTDLLLAIYRRKPFGEPGIDVEGDVALLDDWQRDIGFG
ncbi:maleylpyruvate isomerase family mycothiol-dependent enzyme [Pseudonocardia spinosispora]|uniref:maleylpyruvate isomerase family mycothiol-dependent enzyme n=1 Tax=Pseudonocardia spinosispora TaxID=103441 RepID=UPI0004144B75|nr:maleylpyruvate isomerase family mycothiol-dependent enzyme [Pseudonocardia spinosispora]